MKTSKKLPWITYALCALLVVEGLAWVTWQMLRLERREHEQRLRADEQEALRLALWRMDSAVTPLLAAESARPWFEYRAYFRIDRPYTRLPEDADDALDPMDERLVASPALLAPDELIRLHFEIDADGSIRSPQVPTGPLADRARADDLAGSIGRSQAMLARVQAMLEQPAQRGLSSAARAPQAESNREPDAGQSAEAERTETQQAELGAMQLQRSTDEFAARQQLFEQARNTPPSQSAYLNNLEVPPTRRRAADEPAPLESELADAGEKRDAEGAAANAGAETRETKLAAKPDPDPDRANTTETASREQPETPDRARNDEPAAAPAEPVDTITLLEESARDDRDQDRGERRLLARTLGDAAHELAAGAALGQPPARATDTRIVQGPFEPLWCADPAGGRELLYLRTVRIGDREVRQGFWLDWPAVRQFLLARIIDLAPGADLEPVPTVSILPAAGSPPATGERLASIPARLVLSSIPASTIPAFSPTRQALIVTWLAVILAIAAIGIVLRLSMRLSERRGRFVSAVTHELRTPLTTFCLYSQMLADGMVRDESRRAEYLATLKGESRRLASIVENVLAYARLGRRPAAADRPAAELRPMLDAILPGLHRRAEQGGLTLEARLDDAALDARVPDEPDALGRILTNLVDNACKYAANPDDPRLTLTARRVRDRVHIELADRGPGIPRRERRRIFAAFGRAHRAEITPGSGLGLGLSLARGLARQLGGALDLLPADPPGATFRLTLPAR
ncbi:MAG: ATP-binding protein [Phycisphaerales bacterium JB037]